MIINSFNCEFGYELIAVVPYAYWLYENHQLRGTISGTDSKCLYYFSPSHEINPSRRSWYYGESTALAELIKQGVPNAWIHRSELDTRKWIPPPYKKAYANDWAKLPKEHIVIYNRYNNEWAERIDSPVNYFDLELLERLFRLFKNYSVIYVNVDGHEELYDHSNPIKMQDRELCAEYGVTHIDDLIERHPGLTYNQVQMYYFANTKKFITMNGGGGILASYFGGENIIYTKYCKELEYGDFNYYPLLGGSKIKVVNTYEDIIIHSHLWTARDN